MRTLLLLALFATGAAQAAESRYSPTAALPLRGPTSVSYAGPTLSWARKTLPPAATEAKPEAPAAQTPKRLNEGLLAHVAAGPTPPPPASKPVTVAALAPAQSLQPPAQAAARTTPTPAAEPTQASEAAPHYYSLHREYGLAPDAIPAPPVER